MRIDKKCKIGKACSKPGASRFGIHNPWIGDNGKLYATNGRIAARVTVEGNSVTPGPIDLDIVKAARRDSLEIASDGRERIKGSDGRTWMRPEYSDTTPDVDEVIPSHEKPTPGVTATVAVYLDAKLLWDLVQAMGAECCRLQLGVENGETLGAIRVEPIQHPEKAGIPLPSDGAIMPISGD